MARIISGFNINKQDVPVRGGFRCPKPFVEVRLGNIDETQLWIDTPINEKRVLIKCDYRIYRTLEDYEAGEKEIEVKNIELKEVKDLPDPYIALTVQEYSGSIDIPERARLAVMTMFSQQFGLVAKDFEEIEKVI